MGIFDEREIIFRNTLPRCNISFYEIRFVLNMFCLLALIAIERACLLFCSGDKVCKSESKIIKVKVKVAQMQELLSLLIH